MVFSKVKQWLGIEGTKIAIELSESLSKKNQLVTGNLEFSTLNTQQVLGIKVRLYEVYTRGRRKNKRTSEFLLGEKEVPGTFMVYPDDSKSVAFSLPFDLVQSDMDKMHAKGGILGGIAAFAKKTSGVQSVYRLEVEAMVAGTKLNPFAKKEVVFS